MKLMDVINELNDKFKNEVEIIYRDPTLVCMIPKSQMASLIYGKGANWCQKQKTTFEQWSELGLLIRFLFKDGKKIRFTYFYDEREKDGFYWSNETGHHVLYGTGNPFFVKPRKEDRASVIETDILNYIDKIPVEAKKKVCNFIDKYKEKKYEYCYREDNYLPSNERQLTDSYYKIVSKYNDLYKNEDYRLVYLNSYVSGKDIKLSYSIPLSVQPKDFVFKNLNDFEKELINARLLVAREKESMNENIELEEDYPESWSIEKFKTLSSFSQRVKYCQENLHRISSGSSRIVYRIDDEKVLKLAKNKKGLSQNEIEATYGNYHDLSDITAKVFDYDDDNRWVEMELARKVSASIFKNVTGFSWDDYTRALHNHYYENNPSKRVQSKTVDPEVVKLMWEEPFTYSMLSFIGGYDVPVGDLLRFNSYGLVKRDGVDTIVMIDYGITESTYESYYS